MNMYCLHIICLLGISRMLPQGSRSRQHREVGRDKGLEDGEKSWKPPYRLNKFSGPPSSSSHEITLLVSQEVTTEPILLFTNRLHVATCFL